MKWLIENSTFERLYHAIIGILIIGKPGKSFCQLDPPCDSDYLP